MFLLAATMGCAKSSIPTRHEAAGTLQSSLVVDGRLEDRVTADGADVVLLYGAEERGSLEPCGCPERPRGGAARLASLKGALEDQGDTPLLVNAGGWLEDAMGLDGTPRADVPVLNEWMTQGWAKLAPAAMNVGYPDTSGLTGLGDPRGLPVVSANIEGDGVAAYRLVHSDPPVVVTGISTPGVTFIETPGFTVTSPVTGGESVLRSIAEDHPDAIVVLLSYQAADAAQRLTRTGLVDVVIDANLHRDHDPPFRENGAIWVKAHFQTMRAGELRLWVEEGRVTAAHDRKIDLDPMIPDDVTIDGMAKDARREVSRVQKEVFGKSLDAP